MKLHVTSSERAVYYLGALRLLRFAEQRSPTKRRFGADADALWKDFAGGLKTSDRIDLLLRDADTEWPGAFGARATYGLRAVAEDDAFGADWESLPAIDGERVWKDAAKAAVPSDPAEAIVQLCSGWELTTHPFELPKITPSTRAIVGGASAIVATIHAFASHTDLSWPTQIVVVADRPAERQLAAAAAMLLNTTKATVLLASDDAMPETKKGARPLAIFSPDASAEVRRAIEERTT